MQATNIPDVLMSPVLRNNHDFWGVNTMIASPSGAFAGVGFAIPSDTVNRIVQFPGILVKLDFSWPIMPFVICTPLDRYTCFFSLSRWPAGKSSNTAVPSMLGWAFIWVWINGQKGYLDPWKNKAWERSMVFWFLGANRPCQTCATCTH